MVPRPSDLRCQRLGAGGSGQDRIGRGSEQDRGSRTGRPAELGNRPPRPECPARFNTNRMGYRYPNRGRRIRAAAERIPVA